MPDTFATEVWCDLSSAERNLLTSLRRPILLLRRRAPGGRADAVAPGHPQLGVMLPYTPQHHLLMRESNGPLVMTSGNPSACPSAARRRGWPWAGNLKATFGLVRDDQAMISRDLADLDHFEAYRAFERDVALYERTFDIRPN